MGTSSQSTGPNSKTPLVPSWLEPSSDAPPMGSPDQDGQDGNEQENTPENVPNDSQPNPTPLSPQFSDIPQRFRVPKTNFNRFISSGGLDRNSLKRGVSSYVRTGTGGARNATVKMGASLNSAYRVANVLRSINTQNVQSTLNSLNLGHLLNKPVTEIFTGLTEYICPPGGLIDESLSRDAWIETIVEISEQNMNDLDSLNEDQLREIFALYVSHSIENRIIQDIGSSLVERSLSVDDYNRIDANLHEYILGSVRDTLSRNSNVFSIDSREVQNLVFRLYQDTWNFLESMTGED